MTNLNMNIENLKMREKIPRLKMMTDTSPIACMTLNFMFIY